MKKFCGISLLLLLGASGSAPGQTLPRDTSVFIATDYAFQGPTVVPAGAHTFLLVNRGKELHMMGVARLSGGHSAAETMALMAKGKPTPWVVGVGGPNLAARGDTSNSTVILKPGSYMLSCWVLAPDGALHAMKGMFSQIEVKAVRVERKPPLANATVTLADYKIVTTGAIKRGFTTFKVENRGPQEHDVQVVRMYRGSSEKQIMAWLDAYGNLKGRAPGEVRGGIVGIEKGITTYFTADLEPGEYVLVCLVPDDKDKAHYHRGMVKRFTVQ